MNNAHQDFELLDDRLDIFFREIELAIKWQRPSILLAVYSSEDIHAEAVTALENKITGFGQQVVHIRGADGTNLDIGLFISRIPDADRFIFFVDGLSSQKDHGTLCKGEGDGFDIYQSLNVSREYFVEKQIRIVFWLTEAEAVDLAHCAPDFWASRHRVIDFVESHKSDETLIPVLEPAWQGQGEDKNMTDNLVDTQPKISLRETTQAGLPEWDGSTTAGVNLLLTLGIMHWRKGDHDKADESLHSALEIALKTQDKRLEAICFNAIALVKTDLGMLDQAVEAYEQAIELAPEKTFIWGHLGNLYSQLGLYDEAVEAFLNTLEHNPVDSIAWNSLGNAYVHTGRADEAIDTYRKAVELNDRFIEPWMSLGSLFRKQNLSGDAIKAYQKVTGIDSNHAQAWNELGNIYFELGAFDEALEAYNLAIKLGVESGWSYCNLASAYARKDEFASAIPFYRKSIDLLASDADKAIAWNHLGDAYRQVKDYDHAVSAYQMADNLADASGSSSSTQLNYLHALIVGENIVDELLPDLQEQVQEAAITENVLPDATEPENVMAIEETISVELELAEPEQVDETAEAVAASAPEIDQAAQDVPAPTLESVPAVDAAEGDDLAPVEELVTAEEPAADEHNDIPEIDLRNAHIWNELGNIYFRVAAYDEALEAYNKAMALGLQLGLLYSNLGFACAHKGKFAEAVPLYEKSIELLSSDTDKALSWSRLGDAYSQMNEYVPAVSAYGKAVELDPANLSFGESLNQAREKLVQLDTAAGIEELDQDNVPPAEQAEEAPAPAIADIAEMDGSDDEDASAPEEDESDDVVVAGVVSRLFGEETIPETVSTDNDATTPVSESDPETEQPAQVEEVVAQHPGSSEPSPAPAPDHALVEVQESAEAGPGLPSAEAVVVPATTTAQGLNGMREVDLKNAHIWNELGNIFVKANSFEDAMDAYHKAIELDPEFGWPYSNLGLACTHKGQFGQAIPLYQKSIELFESNTDKAVAWNRLGDAYRQLNEYDNAIAAYQIADELNQHDNASQSAPASFQEDDPGKADLSQATPIFSYMYGGSNDRF